MEKLKISVSEDYPDYTPKSSIECVNQRKQRTIVPTHVITLTQVGTGVYLGQTHLGTPFQVPAWVRKFSLGSTGNEISSLITIQSLFVQQNF